MKPIHLFLPAFILLLASCGLSPEDQATPAPAPSPIHLTPVPPTEMPTITPTLRVIPTLAPTETTIPEIGGDKAVVLWRDNLDTSVPEVFKQYLTPTTPEKWAELQNTMPTITNGERIPLGKALGYVSFENHEEWPMIPGLVRGVVEYGTELGYPKYGVIIEFPVQEGPDGRGGSVFWIGQLMAAANGGPSQSSARLVSGSFPAECAGVTVCTFDKLFNAATIDGKMLNQHDMVSVMQQMVGTVALFAPRPFPEDATIIDAIAHGTTPTDTPGETLGVPLVWH
jgi:hypothetical protein